MHDQFAQTFRQNNRCNGQYLDLGARARGKIWANTGNRACEMRLQPLSPGPCKWMVLLVAMALGLVRFTMQDTVWPACVVKEAPAALSTLGSGAAENVLVKDQRFFKPRQVSLGTSDFCASVVHFFRVFEDSLAKRIWVSRSSQNGD